MQSNIKISSCVALLIGALISSFLFSGAGANLVIFLAAMAGLLISFLVAGHNIVVSAIVENPKSSLLAFVVLLLICILYVFSINRETSYPMSWVFASLPLVFLLASSICAMDRGGQILKASILSLVAMMALYSVVRFFLYGERAHMPLMDPNNYATLMYLTWIPFVHWMLTNENSLVMQSKWGRIAGYCLSFTLLCAMFATQSRMGVYLTGIALLVWIYFGIAHRCRLLSVLPHIFIFILGISLIGNLGESVLNEGTGQASVESGLEIRLLMLESARQMFLDYPWGGTGLLGFGMLYPSYRSLQEQGTAGLFVHNDYVQVLVEGGLPLLACLLVFVGGVGFTCTRLFRQNTSVEDFRRLGYGMAVGAACGHALINFVFYSLPLMIMMGIACAFLLGSGRETNGESIVAQAVKKQGADHRLTIAMYWGGLLFGACAWLFLLLDASVLGVFMDQRSVFWVKHMRSDEEKVLKFARLAQTLNDNRSVPYLGEAILLNRFAVRDPGNSEKRIAAFEKLSQAQLADPLNPAVYIEMARHLESFQVAYIRGNPLQQMEAFLHKATELDPINIPAIDYLLDLYNALGIPEQGVKLLRNKVSPWFELLKRRDKISYQRYFDILLTSAQKNEDRDYLAELENLRSRLEPVEVVIHTPWF